MRRRARFPQRLHAARQTLMCGGKIRRRGQCCQISRFCLARGLPRQQQISQAGQRNRVCRIDRVGAGIQGPGGLAIVIGFRQRAEFDQHRHGFESRLQDREVTSARLGIAPGRRQLPRFCQSGCCIEIRQVLVASHCECDAEGRREPFTNREGHAPINSGIPRLCGG
jgi:hypothetical protein